MKAHAFTVLLIAITLSGCSSTNHVQSSSLRPYLPGIREFLKGFAHSESTNEIDFFFVSPVYYNQDKSKFAYTYWMTGNSLIILDLPVGKMEDPRGYLWYSTKARVDLTTDVVPTPNDIDGSTYLVDVTWVENIIRDSLESGVKVVVQKKEPDIAPKTN